MTRGRWSIILVALGLTLSGCFDLGRTAPPRQVLLRATLPAAAPSAQTPAGVPSLGVPPATIPAYLDRPQLVWRSGPGEVVFGATARWAEPLQGGIARVVAEDLQRLWPQAWVQAGDPPMGTGPRLVLRLHLTRFEGGEDGSVHLEGSWQLAALDGGAVLAEARVQRTGDWSGTEAELVDALSGLLAGWAQELAPVLRQAAEAGGRDEAGQSRPPQ